LTLKPPQHGSEACEERYSIVKRKYDTGDVDDIDKSRLRCFHTNADISFMASKDDDWKSGKDTASPGASNDEGGEGIMLPNIKLVASRDFLRIYRRDFAVPHWPQVLKHRQDKGQANSKQEKTLEDSHNIELFVTLRPFAEALHKYSIQPALKPRSQNIDNPFKPSSDHQSVLLESAGSSRAPTALRW